MPPASSRPSARQRVRAISPQRRAPAPVAVIHVLRRPFDRMAVRGGRASVAGATGQVEDWGQLNAFLTEVTQTRGVTGALARAATRRKRGSGSVDVGPEQLEVTPQGAAGPTRRTDTDAAATTDDGTAPADLIVVAGGNLALIYFNVSDERMTLEESDARYPDLVQALANHPGIGVLVVRSGEQGLLAVGRHGMHHLDDGRIDGQDPLAVYGEHAVAAIRRIDEVEHVGDLVVISTYDPETGEIAAFEELIGAHGGLGGAQTRPFLLHPADWEVDLGPLVGAPVVYQQLRRWMETELGMTFGPTTAPVASDAASSIAQGPSGPQVRAV